MAFFSCSARRTGDCAPTCCPARSLSARAGWTGHRAAEAHLKKLLGQAGLLAVCLPCLLQVRLSMLAGCCVPGLGLGQGRGGLPETLRMLLLDLCGLCGGLLPQLGQLCRLLLLPTPGLLQRLRGTRC